MPRILTAAVLLCAGSIAACSASRADGVAAAAAERFFSGLRF